MKSFTTLCMLACVMAILTFSSCLADQIDRDVLYLRKGQVVYGKIVEFVAGDHLKIQTKDGVVEYLVEEIDRIAKETVPVEGYKMPALAGGLSLVVPGAGQYYNGQVVKGLIVDGACLSGVLLALDSVQNGVIVKPGENTLGLLLILGSWGFSAADASISAADIDAERGQALYGFLPASSKGQEIWSFHPRLFDSHSLALGGELVFRF